MTQPGPKDVLTLLQAAHGQVVGRTRLQKTAYLMAEAGLVPQAFSFSYHHYGPYSEDLSTATKTAVMMDAVTETETTTPWGAKVSTYTLAQALRQPGVEATVEAPHTTLARFAEITTAANAVELELAATALFLAREGHPSPWAETAARKPQKAAENRMENARTLYEALRALPTPTPLPTLMN